MVSPSPSSQGGESNPRERFQAVDLEPLYLDLGSEELERRRAWAREELALCRACPRECAVARAGGEVGVCGVGARARVSSAHPHHGEESCLRGWRGSGTLFFSGCNLTCVFCQNADISQGGLGRECEPEEIAALLLELQALGCHNVNLVTPEHVVPQVVEALVRAIRGGLRVPVVYNTSAYDSVRSLRALEGLVDLYMPDFKVWERETGARLLDAADYPDRAREALREMHRQVGVLRLDRDGVARRGVLVRHLVLPGLKEETAAILAWLARELSPDTHVNIMAQYRPAHRVGVRRRDGSVAHLDIDRPVTGEEMAAAYRAARGAGLWRLDREM